MLPILVFLALVILSSSIALYAASIANRPAIKGKMAGKRFVQPALDDPETVAMLYDALQKEGQRRKQQS